MLKRLAMVLLLALAATRAHAVDFTDVYYNPAEPAWGMFLVQSDTTQFIALFIYGADSKPTWYTATVTLSGSSYTGTLYATTGTYFAMPWTGFTITPIGTLTWTPTDSYHATLAYTVNGIGTVTKTVQRQTLAPFTMSGFYSGSMTGNISGCTDPNNNDASFRARWNLTMTQVADDSATLAFSLVDTQHSGQACTVSGPLTHLGRLYRMANATSTCTGPVGGTFPVTVEVLHPTGQGIEGRWSGPAAGGCTVFYRFAGVLNVNN